MAITPASWMASGDQKVIPQKRLFSMIASKSKISMVPFMYVVKATLSHSCPRPGAGEEAVEGGYCAW